MKKVFACLFLLVMLFAAAMPMAMAEEAAPAPEEATAAIIGGADGPTAIIVAEGAEEAEETEEEGPLSIGEASLYMLKGMVGIFLVTGLIILVLVVMDKAGNRKKDEE